MEEEIGGGGGGGGGVGLDYSMIIDKNIFFRILSRSGRPKLSIKNIEEAQVHSLLLYMNILKVTLLKNIRIFAI